MCGGRASAWCDGIAVVTGVLLPSAVGEDPAKSLTDTPSDFSQASPPSRATPTGSLSSDNKFHSLPFYPSRKCGPNGGMTSSPISLSVQSVAAEQHEGTPQPAPTPTPPAPPGNQYGLEVGSLVEVKESPPLCGVIRWVGQPPGLSEPLAGLELVSITLCQCFPSPVPEDPQPVHIHVPSQLPAN